MDSTTFTYPAPGASGTATGTITVKYAPQGGWEITDSADDNGTPYRKLYAPTDLNALNRCVEVMDTTNTTLLANARYGNGYWALQRGKKGKLISEGGPSFGGGQYILKTKDGTAGQWYMFADRLAFVMVMGTMSDLHTMSSICFAGHLDADVARQSFASVAMHTGSTNFTYAANCSRFNMTGYNTAGTIAEAWGVYDDVENTAMYGGVLAPGLGSSTSDKLGFSNGMFGNVTYPIPRTVDAAFFDKVWILKSQTTRDRLLGTIPGFLSPVLGNITGMGVWTGTAVTIPAKGVDG